jgi:dTDP-4-amino-4,6-dideoxy-D-galactose acyltransferase
MSTYIKAIDWDSNFFSKNIGVVCNSKKVTSFELQQYELLMNKIDVKNADELDRFLKLGFIFVEGEFVFTQPISESYLQERIMLDESTLNYKAKEIDIPQVVALAESSYSNSRFRSPWFSIDEQKEFYGTWIRKAVLGEFDDICLVLKTANEVQGYISLKKQDKKLNVGLIAVSPDYRGKGIAQRLIQLSFKYALENKCESISVATQISNVSATNLYIKSGFTLINTNYWLYKTRIGKI